MSFRKRNIVVSSPGNSPQSSSSAEKDPVPGIRPSPIDGRLTTSTGTRSLDALLAGHAGLALGTSLLIEESGATDFGGILLRYFAAEGIVQGHTVHVLGMNEAWGRDLPGFTGAKEATSNSDDQKGISADRMKIAWRYERLGEFGRGGRSWVCLLHIANRLAINLSFVANSHACSQIELQYYHLWQLLPMRSNNKSFATTST
jgi:elongator complex protein 4